MKNINTSIEIYYGTTLHNSERCTCPPEQARSLFERVLSAYSQKSSEHWRILNPDGLPMKMLMRDTDLDMVLYEDTIPDPRCSMHTFTTKQTNRPAHMWAASRARVRKVLAEQGITVDQFL